MKLPDSVSLAVQGAELVKQIEAVPITDPGGFEQVAALGKTGKRIAEHVEGLFSEAVKAADKAHKSILGLRKIATDNFSEAETLAKQRLIEARAAHEDWEAAGVIFSEKWDFEVTDPAALPRHLLVPDQAKIKGLVTSLGREAEKIVPGIKVTPKLGIAFRSAEEA